MRVISPAPELLRAKKSKDILGDLFFESDRCKDPTLKATLIAATMKINELNRDRYQIMQLFLGLLKQLGGSVLIDKEHVDSIVPEDEIRTDDAVDHIAVNLKGSGLLVR